MENGEEVSQHQIDPLLSKQGFELTQQQRDLIRRLPAYIMPDQDDHRLARSLYIESLNPPRNHKYRIQQIGHGHVYNEKVGGLSHGFRLVDNYSDDGVAS